MPSNAPATAPYGSWTSPITTDLMTAKAVGLSQPQLAGDYLYWLESRPSERGRTTVMRCRADDAASTQELLPAPINVRSKVHEYGGGAYLATEQALYAVVFDDQRLYHLDLTDPAATPEALTPDTDGHWRFADLCLDAARDRLLAVAEIHDPEQSEPANALVAVPLSGGTPQVLYQDSDFVSTPRISPDGEQLCWLSWNHPHMPWDETRLHIARLDTDGGLRETCRVAQPGLSLFQPEWSPAGELLCVADPEGWWNLCHVNLEDGSLRLIAPQQAEFGLPQWQFGMRTYGFLDADTLLASYCRKGGWHLVRLPWRQALNASPEQALELMEKLHPGHRQFGDLVAAAGAAAYIGAAPDRLGELVRYQASAEPGADFAVIKRGLATDLDPAVLSQPEAVRFATDDGEQAYGFFYPPTNPDFQGPEGERPPLIVLAHGGPTGQAAPVLNFKVQFWTSRGFAVLDVNYRGSTGYGRAYRDRLYGGWGRIDIADVCAGARAMAEQGRVDPQRLIIRGSSAGGLTVLGALAFADTFAAGCSLYGIGDLEALVRDTHKFESRYTDNLVAPYPEQAAEYRARSPLHHLEGFNCPVIFFQGLDDKVVPPNQAEAMVQALDDKALPVAYIAFAGEGHGFRQATTIARAFTSELAFYSQVFGFTPGEAVPEVPIRNLESR